LRFNLRRIPETDEIGLSLRIKTCEAFSSRVLASALFADPRCAGSRPSASHSGNAKWLSGWQGRLLISRGLPARLEERDVKNSPAAFDLVVIPDCLPCEWDGLSDPNAVFLELARVSLPFAKRRALMMSFVFTPLFLAKHEERTIQRLIRSSVLMVLTETIMKWLPIRQRGCR